MRHTTQARRPLTTEQLHSITLSILALGLCIAFSACTTENSASITNITNNTHDITNNTQDITNNTQEIRQTPVDNPQTPLEAPVAPSQTSVELLTFTVRNNVTGINGNITLFTNATTPVFVQTYCGVPFALLKNQNNVWSYVYPDMLECSTPITTAFENNSLTTLQSIAQHLRDKKPLIPSAYIVKVFYATTNITEWREFNIPITIQS